VRQAAVQLDSGLVFVVIAIPVGDLAVDVDTRLMPGTRQAVSTLDITQIPVFKHRVNSVTGRPENLIKLGTPAHFLAHRQSSTQPFLGAQPPTAGPGNPAADIVERPGELNQIEHRLLDRRPGRLKAGLSGFGNAAGYTDDEAGAAHPPRSGHRQVDRPGRRIDEPVQLGRRLMAEHGAISSAEHGRPQPGVAAGRTSESRVDPPVQHLPAPTLEARIDDLRS
jgi:hypothetical protein